jgi:hypothetical protein
MSAGAYVWAMRRLLILTGVLLLVAGLLIAGGAAAKKHKRLRLTCDQTTEEVARVAEQYRTQYNAMGWTIEPAPEGVIASSACRNIARLTRQGKFFMADVHHYDTDPPFPGETDPRVNEYHWFADVIVHRTKKGKLTDTVQNFQCVKDYIDDSPPFEQHEIPC